MFNDSYTLNFAGTGDLVLTKRREDGYSSEFAGTIGLTDFVMTIKHTIPKNRGGGETSHMVRIDATEYNSSNEIVGSYSVWRPFVSRIGQQDATKVTQLNTSLSGFLTAPNLVKLLAGES